MTYVNTKIITSINYKYILINFRFKMGNADTKLNFRKAVVQLTTKTQVL